MRSLASYGELNCDGVAPQLYTDIDLGFSAYYINSETTYRYIDDVVGEITACRPVRSSMWAETK